MITYFGTDLESSKRTLFDLIGYSPVSGDTAQEKAARDVVWSFHLDEHPFQVISAPARTSKSWSSSPEAVHDFFPLFDEEAYKRNEFVAKSSENIVWLVGVDFNTIKEWDYCWTYLIDRGLIEQLGGEIESAQNNPRQGNMLIRVRWPFKTAEGDPCRSILEAKSANNERALQGEEVRTAILSEAAEHDKRILEKYLGTRCGRIIFPTTPKRRALWLWEFFQAGADDESLGVAHFQFTRFCNPTYDHERYDRAKAKSVLTYGAIENDPEFMEQFEGEWTFEGGKVIPFRWVQEVDGPACNVVQEIPSWVADATFYVALDYGYNDPAVALFVAIAPDDQKLILSEVYERGLEPVAFTNMAKKRREDLGLEIAYWLPDPMQPFLTDILRQHGLPLYEHMRRNEITDRAAGLQRLRDELSVDPATNKPKLQVHASCENTILEWKNVRFKDAARDEFSGNSIVGGDHSLDAIRYLLMSRPKPNAMDLDWIEKFQRDVRDTERWRKKNLRRAAPMIGHTPASFLEAS